MSDRKPNIIHKAGGILIQNRKLLVEKSFNKHSFIAPGGRVEVGETPPQTLIRELKEEFGITVSEADLEPLGQFKAEAEGMPGTDIIMDVFTVKRWYGDPQPNSEVEKILWLDSSIPENTSIGSIIQLQIIPLLKEKNLIN